MLENGKSASQTSKVDENGSPRLILWENSRISLASNNDSAIEHSRVLDESVDSASVFASSDSAELETKQSSHFGLGKVVSKYMAANLGMIATMKAERDRPSIGVGKLLEQSFPDASTSIDTSIFRAPLLANPIVDSIVSGTAIPDPKDTAHLSHDRSLFQTHLSPDRLPVAIVLEKNETGRFDLDRLNVSVAAEQPSSAASFLVSRIPSRGPQSPEDDGNDLAASPPSFNTRLGKMIMPPPARNGQISVLEPNKERDSERYAAREQSMTVDAETTLVNGEGFGEGKEPLTPQRQQKSSSSSSDDGEYLLGSASKQAFSQALRSDQRFWNQKVAETQQTVLEILEQVSQVSILFHLGERILTNVETPLTFL